ncbi:SIMPL domain-containing protein [Paramaledivibacter caminithermalis]|jgi:uncharacterized protein YggE|uniref:SIMPL domain-containing protein n=1 Tax=Paramaledivibacter caminithermalis (strain DSM 15212 / CIP 107654 / DViRD3) TaxID=1121301 RepID=A0A1M6ME27_PARC5|nr:SIMPL domain-containing protein [Paramaledivibacter caminithermalis]SHJ81697.1 hypothetical protein SAMN02745912_01191 [Paramaledivibacter caminithermalis DSM 15212]
MKKIFYILMIPMLIASLFVFDSLDVFSSKAAANELSKFEGNIVTVNGMGAVKVKPDIAYISLGVETFNVDAKKAQEDIAKQMDKIVDTLKKNGIEDEDIKTTGYNIYKTSKYEPANLGEKKNRIEGYIARNIAEVTIRDIDKVGNVIDLAGKAGANIINNIRFGITNEEEYYNKALKLAMKNASGKAEAVLSTFGVKPEKPYRIIENSYGAPIVYRDNAMMKASMVAENYETPVEAGELEVTARVTVEYKY